MKIWEFFNESTQKDEENLRWLILHLASVVPSGLKLMCSMAQPEFTECVKEILNESGREMK